MQRSQTTHLILIPTPSEGVDTSGTKSFSLLRLLLLAEGVRDFLPPSLGDLTRSLGDLLRSLGDLSLGDLTRGDLERSDLAVPGGSSDVGVRVASESALSGVSGLSMGS